MTKQLTKTNFPLVGTKFRGRDAMDLVKALPHDTKLTLKPEFDNQYDNSAIAIYASPSATDVVPEEILTHIGYLPAVTNGEIAATIRSGFDPAGFIVTFDASETGKPRVNIHIKPELIHD